MGLKELREQVAKERAKKSLESHASARNQEEKQLKKELFALKHRKKVRVIKAISAGASRVGRGLNVVAKKGVSAYKKAEKKSSKKKKKKPSFGFGNMNSKLPDYSSFTG